MDAANRDPLGPGARAIALAPTRVRCGAILIAPPEWPAKRAAMTGVKRLICSSLNSLHFDACSSFRYVQYSVFASTGALGLCENHPRGRAESHPYRMDGPVWDGR